MEARRRRCSSPSIGPVGARSSPRRVSRLRRAPRHIRDESLPRRPVLVAGVASGRRMVRTDVSPMSSTPDAQGAHPADSRIPSAAHGQSARRHHGHARPLQAFLPCPVRDNVLLPITRYTKLNYIKVLEEIVQYLVQLLIFFLIGNN